MCERKTIYTLNIGFGTPSAYAPEITELTYPLIAAYADRMGAEFLVIDQRKFPTWPVTYEKLQIYDLAQRREDSWSIFVDSDALVHPETIDFTQHIPRDTVAHNGSDMASVRWTYDRFFRRDGRNVGSCNWFTLASDWCVELWKPLDDMTLAQALRNIHPTVAELTTVITREHLIDDYTLSRNIAKYGLKFVTIKDLLKDIGLPDANFFWHTYTDTIGEKVRLMKETLERWKIEQWRAALG